MAQERLIAAILAATLSCAPAHAADFARQVRTQSGVVAGATEQGVLYFKGIAYAQPPIGRLRWRAPLPAKPWKGVRQATRYGHDCMQLPFPADDAPIRTKPAEDCLFLNVWRPAESTATPLPVMVWIYGGGFGAPRQSGPPTSAGPMADGELVSADPGVIYRAAGAIKVPFMIDANTADIPSMDESARFVVATLSAQGQKVFEYRFGYVVDSMRDTWETGTPHAKEIPFVFETLAARYGQAVTAHDAAVARATHAYWVNFGKFGDPNGPGLAPWPAYSTGADQLMIFQADGAAAGQKDPWKARLDVTAQRAEAPAVKP
jgi:carboxylesterase type B